MEFPVLWQEVAAMLEIPEEDRKKKKPRFYSELMLDDRFAALKDNRWDLRDRRTYNELHAYAELVDDAAEDEEEEELPEEEEESGENLNGEEAY